jgi:hypothetical protein
VIIPCPSCGRTDTVHPVHGSVYGMGLSGRIPDGCWCPTGMLECEACALESFRRPVVHSSECEAYHAAQMRVPGWSRLEGTKCLESCPVHRRSGIFEEPEPYVCTSNPVTRGDLPEQWWQVEPWKTIVYGSPDPAVAGQA